jgi:hypothetical protein
VDITWPEASTPGEQPEVKVQLVATKDYPASQESEYMHVCMYVCMYVCLYTRISTFIPSVCNVLCMYVCMYVVKVQLVATKDYPASQESEYMHVCMYVCMYVCIPEFPLLSHRYVMFYVCMSVCMWSRYNL